MRRRLILHLGLPKTGSTTLQGFFRRNRRQLAAMGVIYPVSGQVKGGQHPLASEVRIGRNSHAPRGARPPAWSAVFREVEKTDCHTAVISDEGISDSFRKLGVDFRPLKAEFSEFDVFGVVYLRAQEPWVTSYYGQKVRGEARTSCSLSEFRLYRKVEYLRYSRLLDRIANAIPLDHLLVGNFDEAARTGLLSDFIRIAGLPGQIVDAEEETQTRNVSLPHWATLFLLLCNAEKMPSERFSIVRDALRDVGAGGEELDLRPGLDVATPVERQRLRKIMAGDAPRLAERYGVELQGAQAEAPYRPFERDDFDVIRNALYPKLDDVTRRCLQEMTPTFPR
jgi:hypothetical protein